MGTWDVGPFDNDIRTGQRLAPPHEPVHLWGGSPDWTGRRPARSHAAPHPVAWEPPCDYALADSRRADFSAQ